MKHYSRILLVSCALGMLAACSSAPEKPPYAGVKLGKPYEIDGRWYKPHYDPHYDETGMASWYGPGFHGKSAANGEIFDENELTAAHKTLPLPSIVRVTNLSTGKSAIVKVNDRGPFVGDRIIDLSKAAAKKLGIYGTGVAEVRVQFLDQETRQYAAAHHISYSQYAGEIPQNQWHKEMQADVTPAADTPSPTVMAANTVSVQNQDLPALQPAAHTARIPAPDIFSVVDDAQAGEPVPEPAAHSYVAPSHAPAPAPIVTAQNGFFVQAGTFSVMQNAQTLKQRIDTLGTVSIKPLQSSSKTLYRVVAGPYDTKENAKKLLSKLAYLGISDAKIFFD